MISTTMVLVLVLSSSVRQLREQQAKHDAELHRVQREKLATQDVDGSSQNIKE